MALKNAFRASLHIAGADFGEWDGASGGDYDLTTTKYTPFDGEERVYGGKKTTTDVTLEADYSAAEAERLFKGKELRGLPATAVVLDRDEHGNYQQNRPPYSGLVKQIIWPDYDSNDAATIVKMTVVVSVGVVVGAGT